MFSRLSPLPGPLPARSSRGEGAEAEAPPAPRSFVAYPAYAPLYAEITQRDQKADLPDDREGAIAKATTSDLKAAERAAKDPTRPVFHLTSPANWINDPNAPIYHHGHYHLFYQHNPYGDDWGHMHWGHWRSRDLAHWEQLPIALWPSQALGEEHCFSGCATLDPSGRPLAFYTSIGHREPQCWIATPEDDQLIKWKKFPANPILTQNSPGMKYYDFRDPFVFRHQNRTYMVHGGNLNQAKGGQACVSLYEATNDELTKWKFKSILFTDTNSANIECPNFFPLGDKFVLITSPHRRCDYFVGTFDAQAGRFIQESRGLVDGTDAFYAPNGLEDPRGRRILWGWIRGFKAGRGWNGCMSVPRRLSLRDGRLVQQPALELTKLRADHHREHNLRLAGASYLVSKAQGDTIEITATFLLGDAKNAGLRLRRSTDGQRALEIKYDGVTLDVAGTQLPLPSVSSGKRLMLQVFLDRSVLEVFADDGRVCITRVVYAEEQDQGIELFANGGLAKVESFDVWQMKSIW